MLLVHGTNGDVDTVNLLAQTRRLDAGELGAGSVAAPDRDYRLYEGDCIVPRGAPLRLSHGNRIENGTAMRVVGVEESADRIAVRFERADATEALATLDLAPLRQADASLRRPALRLAYAMHPNPAQGATVARTATLGQAIADRNAVYVADTRARYGHTVHLAREDFGTQGTDGERLMQYAATISDSRVRRASIGYARSEGRRLSDSEGLGR
jgi:hypothetical protein